MRRCAVALLLVAAVAGCESARPANQPSWRNPAASAPSPDRSPDSAAAGPSGILTTSLGTDPQATTTKLTIHDVQTGRPVFTGSMPGWPLRTRLHRQSFSPDWTLDGQGRPAVRMDVAMSGTEQSASTLVASERALVSAEVRVTADTAATSIFYVCQEPVDDQTLLCVAQGGGQVYGAVALLTADREAKTVTLRQGIPKVEGGVRGAYLAPDRTRVAIHTDGGWYLADLGSGGEPRPLFPQLATQGADVQFWG
ncbi:MAG TPA: hypothetical protein VF462_14350 [Micromonosporaceae bacterium]